MTVRMKTKGRVRFVVPEIVVIDDVMFKVTTPMFTSSQRGLCHLELELIISEDESSASVITQKGD